MPAGAISIEPPATPDSLSLVSTTSAVGSPGFCGWKLNDGGDSSMWTVIELLPVFGWPCGPTARFHAMHETLWTPSPSTTSPTAGYDLALASSTLQFIPPTPEGPALGKASTVTAWLTQKPGFGSFGVRNDTPTGSLSTKTLSVAVLTMPAAFVALSAIWNFPSVGTCDRVSTPNDQLTGLGHCCQTESSRGSEGPFNVPLGSEAPEEQIPETSLEDSVTGKSSPGGFHTYEPVAHRVPCPVTEGRRVFGALERDPGDREPRRR